LGRLAGATEAQSVAVVRRALDLGVNFVDTAEAYGTEALVGEALRGTRRRDVVLSTKKHVTDHGRLITAAELTYGLEASLTRLQTDYVDVYHLHGTRADQYDHAVAELVRASVAARSGKIRFLGITERFRRSRPCMMARAVRDPYWDVVMVGFNIFNQSARDRVFVETRRREIECSACGPCAARCLA
jgi:aryl-alcohol dehydrogenase-like predicted oxidoreductase